jgi:hypothetical protein
MATNDASTRLDVISNAVQREIRSVRGVPSSTNTPESGLDEKLEHDPLVWTREHLEPYLDSDRNGRVPANDAALQSALDSAFARSQELLRSTIEPALADSGVYAGIVIWEGNELLLQRISRTSAIVHQKCMLTELPHVGQKVQIAYKNGIAILHELARQRQSRGLER